MMRKRLTLALVSGLLLLLPLAGCAAEPVELQAATAENLQSAMLGITEAAAGGDFTEAQSLLTAMQGNLRTAAAAGQVSAERSASIQTAINRVSTDLTVEIEAAAIAAEAAAEAAALAEEQNAKDAAEDARDAEKKAAEDAKDAREECLDDKDRVKAGECN
ncbi:MULTISPECIES: mucin-associated surface protein [unclassified Cryobacterium]|uniref:mucin-associated surface protein n=1 Tax=unclassified Cryobacterium TaxID=2649013 RepID=UPI001068EAD8|nr:MULTISPECIES: mucin-associated surface protein [unclassified Cryobacterium]TFD08839.1 mucin-associated surface protein [Cryobacterium sp. TMT1-2-2]TFD10664.1 mucin-associated surface protein [Cryobacterium sp. TMT1-66-1]